MEYLMTYGWAILIIAVVLGALYYLGIFGSATSGPRAQPGSCQVIRPLGPGTTSYINLEGVCTGQLPQFVAQFNGQSSYVNIGNGAGLDFGTNDFTIVVWATTFGGITRRGIINKGGWASTGYAIQEAGSPANTYYFVVRDSIGYNSVTLPLHDTWGWTQIVAIKTSNHLEAWVNGVKVGQYDVAIGSLSNPAKALEIGRSYDPYYFNGLISNVQIYNASLDASAIQSLYSEGIGGAPIPSPYLVGWWPLNGNSNDYSGDNNNGASSGVTFTSTWTR